MLSHSQRCDVKWPLALQDAASTPVTEGIGGTWVALSYICSFTGISGQKDGVYSFLHFWRMVLSYVLLLVRYLK